MQSRFDLVCASKVVPMDHTLAIWCMVHRKMADNLTASSLIWWLDSDWWFITAQLAVWGLFLVEHINSISDKILRMNCKWLWIKNYVRLFFVSNYFWGTANKQDIQEEVHCLLNYYYYYFFFLHRSIIVYSQEWCRDGVKTCKTNSPLVLWRFSYGFLIIVFMSIYE